MATVPSPQETKPSKRKNKKSALLITPPPKKRKLNPAKEPEVRPIKVSDTKLNKVPSQDVIMWTRLRDYLIKNTTSGYLDPEHYNRNPGTNQIVLIEAIRNPTSNKSFEELKDIGDKINIVSIGGEQSYVSDVLCEVIKRNLT